jgi:hypothetical protein
MRPAARNSLLFSLRVTMLTGRAAHQRDAKTIRTKLTATIVTATSLAVIDQYGN